jgi:gas vesicle protein
MFWKRKKTRLELLREAALDHAHDALETAQDVLHQAGEVVHDKLENAPDTIGDLKSSAGESLGEAVARVSSAMSALGSRVGDAAQTAKKGAQEHFSHAGETAAETADEARDVLNKKRRKLEKKLAKTQRAAQEKKNEVVKRHAPEVVVQDDGQKWIWLGVGILAGAVLGVLLAPSSGRRNRALLRDKLAKGAHKAEGLGEAAARKAHDLSNRADGLAHAVAEKISSKADGESDGADDVTIADRVRTELGRVPETQGMERLNIESCNGVVTLRGPVMDEAAQAAIIAAAGKVQGVREVISDLVVENDEEEKFVG